jgi:hypothetical protein
MTISCYFAWYCKCCIIMHMQLQYVDNCNTHSVINKSNFIFSDCKCYSLSNVTAILKPHWRGPVPGVSSGHHFRPWRVHDIGKSINCLSNNDWFQYRYVTPHACCAFSYCEVSSYFIMQKRNLLMGCFGGLNCVVWNKTNLLLLACRICSVYVVSFPYLL